MLHSVSDVSVKCRHVIACCLCLSVVFRCVLEGSGSQKSIGRPRFSSKFCALFYEQTSLATTNCVISAAEHIRKPFLIFRI